ncbi:TetR/AcrR family transcriptional regulator [Ruminococcaceae bacterium OttesenSCG-928-D13]|nr:TetR/AcrR family transcriptional regulator [Ruminococcaceae bacterium OttesenSCG-928-D13]
MKTADKIRERALALFAANGYAGTSVDTIAKEAGIRKSTIYSHVESKEALFFSLFEEALAWDLAYFRDLLAEHAADSAEQKLYRMFRHDYDIYRAENDRANISMKFVHTAMLFPPPGARVRMEDLFAAYEAQFSAMMLEVAAQGVAEGTMEDQDRETLLAWYYCVVDGLFLGSFYYGRGEYQKRFDHIWSMFWDSIKRKQG